MSKQELTFRLILLVVNALYMLFTKEQILKITSFVAFVVMLVGTIGVLYE